MPVRSRRSDALLRILGIALALAGCSSPSEATRQAATPKVPKGMVFIKGGTFTMGMESGFPDEQPAHKVTISDFYIDEHEVTNDQFAAFVAATGYKTTAEKPLDPTQFPGVPKEKLRPGAAVFTTGKGWGFVAGADWRHPAGPGSSVEGKGNHPVVQVSWDDAVAYSRWAGKRLPSEAEFEYIAQSGRPNPKTIWGDADFDAKNPQANIWQGAFPDTNDNDDGYLTTAPVKSFPPTPWGLYDVAGNVWEWCSDWYAVDAYKASVWENPKGPSKSNDPAEPSVAKRVMRGGSFLCADCSCRGYRPTSRMKSSPDTGLFHTGFRCVKDAF